MQNSDDVQNSKIYDHCLKKNHEMKLVENNNSLSGKVGKFI